MRYFIHGNRLKKLRESNNLTVAQLAKKADVNYIVIKHAESMDALYDIQATPIRHKTIEKLAKALDVGVFELLITE